MVTTNPDASQEARITELEEKMAVVAKLFENLSSQIDSVHNHSKTINNKIDVLAKIVFAIADFIKKDPTP